MMLRARQHVGMVALASILLVTCACAPALAQQRAAGVVFDDANGNRQRDAGEAGIAGVGVSDGESIVATDAHGRWSLPADDDCVFFVLKPSGWMPPVDADGTTRFSYVHRPAGSPGLRYGGIAPTGPLPASIDFPLRRAVEPTRFDVLLLADTHAMSVEHNRIFREDVVQRAVGTRCAFGVTLGDLCEDGVSFAQPYRETIGLLGKPWWSVFGNNDQDHDASDDATSDDTYEQQFGPVNYAFDYGPVHFLVLDTMIWRGEDAFAPSVLAFVRSDLARLPAERPVVLMMHIPPQYVANRAELFALLAERPTLVSLSGHVHFTEQSFLGPEQGWSGAGQFLSVIAPAASGSKWAGPLDAQGIPDATQYDGAPNGHLVATFSARGLDSLVFVGAGEGGRQMTITAPETLSSEAAGGAEVFANVFGGSERSTVEMRLGATGAWSAMERVVRPDPAYVRLLEANRDLAPPALGMWDPMDCPHLWRGLLPASPPVGEHLLHIRTSDMYGNRYEETALIHITD